jgi:hypothetical protein
MRNDYSGKLSFDWLPYGGINCMAMKGILSACFGTCPYGFSRKDFSLLLTLGLEYYFLLLVTLSAEAYRNIYENILPPTHGHLCHDFLWRLRKSSCRNETGGI